MQALPLSRSFLVSAAFLLTLCLFPLVAAGTVSVRYSMDDQLPLVARVDTPYSWTFSNTTFVSSKNASLEYVAANLPGWLAFNPSTRTFSGTPTASDEGSPSIKVTARDPESSDAASSIFDLCVSSARPPQLQHTVGEQFRVSNPSLSSVFLVSGMSALRSQVPALRIPPKWSFSIGFQYDTFTADSDGDIYYAALQADGSPLPDWIDFNSRSITFDGVTPSSNDTRTPHTLSLALHASDQEGYSAASLPFDIWIAAHELSLAASSLPTVNITAETPFSVSFSSPADFSGVLLDGNAIQPSDIVEMEVDTSFYGGWLKYDTASRTLSGTPPEDMNEDKNIPILPVTIETNINQTIETNVSLAVVPSYFSSATLQPVLVQSGHTLTFSLTPFFSNATGVNGHDDVSLTASFDPEDSTSFLQFDPSASTIAGTIPANFTKYTHITVALTAYSHITHSTSHTSLPISLTPADYSSTKKASSASGLSASTRAKLLLGLKIAFGVIGGLVLLGLILATLRRCARVKDTALEGEEGMRAWTVEEKKWYGIGIEVDGEALDVPKDEYAAADLARTQTRRTGSNAGTSLFSPGSALLSPGVMRKSEFMGKIRGAARHVGNTVRVVSNSIATTVAGGGSTARKRPIIGKPMMLMTEDGRRAAANNPFDDRNARPETPAQNPFEDTGLSQYAVSAMTGTSIVGSPSSSTGGRSIPRRRPDFAPPGAGLSPLLVTTPVQAHLATTHAVSLTRKPSNDSVMSLDSGDSVESVQTHATEAVVQHAERARSVRSVRSTSVFSFQTHRTNQTTNSQGQENAPPPAPRLVPFTSSSRVPVPKLPENGTTTEQPVRPRKKRVVSQMAKVFRSASTERRVRESEGPAGEGGDELSVGYEYVRALGDDLRSGSIGLSPSPSFSVAESSRIGPDITKDKVGAVPTTPTPVPRMLARTGEPFRFRVALTLPAAAATALEVRLVSGEKLPKFIKVESVSLGARDQKRTVELSGMSGKTDVGEYNVGVYEKGTAGECMGRVVLEVVERSRDV